MTNLESILKSRDIPLPTMSHIVKAMVFSLVMYECKGWTIKKGEHCRNDAFELSDQIRSVAQLCPAICDPMNLSTPGLPVHHQLLEFTETLESPLDCKEFQSVHPKGDQS